MKLSNLTLIFIIIIIPIILVVSYYMSLQIDTINMQTSYNTKLLQATKEAIESFEINTVEWNDAYSETADSKRRDIMASINTFTTSFANSIGVGGASKETILAYVPAIAYTLYDGYYIYSPTETKKVAKDEKGLAMFKENGDIDYADGTDYSHILKPYTAYSARYKTGDTNIVVNYTLDNYITIYGKVNGVYQAKSGYLINTNTDKINIPTENWKGIKVEVNNESTDIIEPETLTEIVAWKGEEDNEYTVDKCTYIYDEDNTKVYFDKNTNTPFQVSSTGIRTDLSELKSVKYKKLSIYNGEDSCIQIYQALNDGVDSNGNKREHEKWYIEKNSPKDSYDNSMHPNTEKYELNSIQLKNDVSAINYYTESYAFSKWVSNNLNSIKVKDMKDTNEELITIKEAKGNSFIFKDAEDKNSLFNLHKREVIKQALISNLNQAITSYSRNSKGEFQLPVLSETDWDQVLRNVSIITFVQGIPIGMKYYNNYAIATSTSNKEYVDPNEIYLSSRDDAYYHLPYCKEIKSTGKLMGYRSIDYIVRSYVEKEGETETTKYYYRHGEDKQEDYYCLVQRSLYEESINVDKITAYETALAREKYATRKTTVPKIVLADANEEPVPETIEIFNDTDADLKGNIDITKAGTYKITLVAGGGRRTIR